MVNWFSADYHLGHKNIIKYCHRPFKNIYEMNHTILNNLDKTTNPGDTLFYLGDLTFEQELAEIFFQKFDYLNIHYIIGNHDTSEVIKKKKKNCVSVSQLKDIIINEQAITLCHYAMRVWNKSHYNAWQFYAHSHGRLEPQGKQYDVGVDNNQYLPRSFEEIQQIMKEYPDNFNYSPPEET